MELCSMLCGSLDGRGVWGRMDTCIYTAESLCCSPETIVTLFVNWLYPKYKIQGFFKKDLRSRPQAQFSCLIDTSLPQYLVGHC